MEIECPLGNRDVTLGPLVAADNTRAFARRTAGNNSSRPPYLYVKDPPSAGPARVKPM